jgi:hypothetical protein
LGSHAEKPERGGVGSNSIPTLTLRAHFFECVTLLAEEKDNIPDIIAYFITTTSGAQLKALTGDVSVTFFSDDQRERVTNFKTSLYTSDSDGLIYTKALEDVIMSPGNLFSAEVSGNRGAQTAEP